MSDLSKTTKAFIEARLPWSEAMREKSLEEIRAWLEAKRVVISGVEDVIDKNPKESDLLCLVIESLEMIGEKMANEWLDLPGQSSTGK